MECEFPSVNSNKQEIKEIFNTVKTIAVLGYQFAIVAGFLL